MKTTKKQRAVKPPTPVLDCPNHQPTREAISACAYHIWEREGCPAGRDVEHWLQAEKQLRQGKF